MLSLRLDENLMNKVESSAFFDNQSKSDFIRKALLDSTKYTEVFPTEVPPSAIDFVLRTLEPIKSIKVYCPEKNTNKGSSESSEKMEKLNIAVRLFQNSQTMLFSGDAIKILLDELSFEQIEKVAIKIFHSEYIGLQKALLNNEEILEFISEELLNERTLMEFIRFCLRYFTNEILSEKGRKWFEKCQITQSGNTITFVGKHNGGLKFSHFFMHYFEHYLGFIPFEQYDEPLLNADSLKLTYNLLIGNEEIINLPQIIKQMNEKVAMMVDC